MKLISFFQEKCNNKKVKNIPSLKDILEKLALGVIY